MEGDGGDFLDWEVVPGSETVLVDSSHLPENLREVMDGNSVNVIRSDYFSPDSVNKCSRTVGSCEESSVGSGNPSRIDPALELLSKRENSGEFSSDSGNVRSKISDFEGNNEVGFVETDKGDVGFVENVKSHEGFELSNGTQTHRDGTANAEFDDLEKKVEKGIGASVETFNVSVLFVEEIAEIDMISEVDGGEGQKIVEASGKDIEVKLPREVDGGEGQKIVEDSGKEIEVKLPSRVEGKRKIEWWKLPVELLKYCLSRTSPVWSFSVAAAVVGFVILGRRLHKMREKRRRLQIKLILDDKKVSQFMSGAARLNEAFSVVRRSPIIRSSLPSAGTSSWPLTSAR